MWAFNTRHKRYIHLLLCLIFKMQHCISHIAGHWHSYNQMLFLLEKECGVILQELTSFCHQRSNYSYALFCWSWPQAEAFGRVFHFHNYLRVAVCFLLSKHGTCLPDNYNEGGLLRCFSIFCDHYWWKKWPRMWQDSLSACLGILV